MKNIIICSNCGTENSYQILTCKKCQSYLRARVVNIDFWKVTWGVFESPIKSFTTIIFAEHKNFVLILSVLIGIKFFINSFIFSNIFTTKPEAINFLFLNSLLSIGYFLVLLHLFSFKITFVNKALGINSRFKDNYSIYSFAMIPQVFALLILTPMEYAIFGKYWFTYNPSPFLLKSLSAYLFIGIEILMITWSFILFMLATFVQTKGKVYSFIIGILLGITLFAGMIFLPLLPF